MVGTEPVEAEMFDLDGMGNIQVSLLSHETLYIPFTFLTFQEMKKEINNSLMSAQSKTKSQSRTKLRNQNLIEKKENSNQTSFDDLEEDNDENPSRIIDVRVISGSHGHVVAALRVQVNPRPFSVTRHLVFYEPENSIMKRRIQIKGNTTMAMFPNDKIYASKYIHCVEVNDSNNVIEKGNGQVLVEWGPSESDLTGQGFTGAGSLDVIIRYRCLNFPSFGSFYILIYNDPYQCSLHEVIIIYLFMFNFLCFNFLH